MRATTMQRARVKFDRQPQPPLCLTQKMSLSEYSNNAWFNYNTHVIVEQEKNFLDCSEQSSAGFRPRPRFTAGMTGIYELLDNEIDNKENVG